MRARAIRGKSAMRAGSSDWRYANIDSRKKAPPGGRQSRARQRRVPRPIEAKESGRWVRGLCEAYRLLSEAAMVTSISDCEGDLYELFAAPRSTHVHRLVRAEPNRVLSDGGKLFAAMAALPQVEGQEIAIPAKAG